MAQYTDKAEDADTVIHALKKAVFRGRIRMTEFFSDFDPLRTGYMSAGKFRTALEACGAMPLNERQMQVLTLRYIDPTDDQRVRYLDLLQEIEKVFTTADMQYDPHSAAVDFTPNLIKEGTMLPPAHEEAVQIVLARLSHLVRVRAPPPQLAPSTSPPPPRPPAAPRVSARFSPPRLGTASSPSMPTPPPSSDRHLPRRSTPLSLACLARQTKGLLLRQPFDDYMKNVNSPKQIDEVTYVQFRNGLGRTGLEVSGDETELIALKFPGKAKVASHTIQPNPNPSPSPGPNLTLPLTRATSTTWPSCAPSTRASASSLHASPGPTCSPPTSCTEASVSRARCWARTSRAGWPRLLTGLRSTRRPLTRT